MEVRHADPGHIGVALWNGHEVRAIFLRLTRPARPEQFSVEHGIEIVLNNAAYPRRIGAASVRVALWLVRLGMPIPEEAIGKRYTRREIMEMQIGNGGFSKATLRKLGIAWPPVKGWIDRYVFESERIRANIEGDEWDEIAEAVQNETIPERLARPTLKIYTDGACLGNPGRGGWAYILDRDGARTEASGAEPRRTTNNRMEMQAAIEALSALTEPSDVQIITDSEYLALGMTSRLPRRRKMFDRQRTGGKEVPNRDLWDALDLLAQRHQISWYVVRGHSGDQSNERCDFLANEQAGIKDGDEWWRAIKNGRAQRRPKPDDPWDVFAVIEETEGG